MGSFDGWTSFAGTKSVEERFKPSLVARARKREVIQLSNGIYSVLGDSRLNDTHPRYSVLYNASARKWMCECYDSQYGDSRKRKACSHVIAVLLYREENGVGAHGNHDTGPASVQTAVVEEGDGTALPVAPSSPPLKKRKKKKEKESSGNALQPVQVWLAPSDPRLAIGAPVPEWLSEYRDHQVAAALEIEEAFAEGARIVYVDAPPGSGKTVLADVTARLLQEARSTYVCTSKNLQGQVLRDFPYAHQIMGRANYTPINPVLGATCDDCTGEPGEDDSCDYCPSMKMCPYRVAKREAVESQLAVLNTAYWLREANFAGEFHRPQRLAIIDECDTLEDQLLDFVHFSVTDRRLEGLELEPPKKGSHYTTISAWLREDFNAAVTKKMSRLPHTMHGRREWRGLNQLLGEGLRVADHLENEAKTWFRDNKAYGGGLTMKPIVVDAFGEDFVWQHAAKFVMMSGTIISSEELHADLGATGTYRTVRVPMTFPVENRIVNVAGVASMDYKHQQESLPIVAKALGKILERHPYDRILVHTVSYKNTEYFLNALREAGHGARLITHDAKTKDAMLAKYRGQMGAVMLSPSLDRGVDLKGEDCRVQVIVKMPRPSIGDERVSRRMHAPGGNEWYTVQTIRTLVQMTGRAVRTADDHATTYILDRAFTELRRKHRALFPEWWLEGLNTRFATRELM